jgi:hypothetical protein
LYRQANTRTQKQHHIGEERMTYSGKVDIQQVIDESLFRVSLASYRTGLSGSGDRWI